MNNEHDHTPDSTPESTPEPTRGDTLDALLRGWHDEHKSAASASRDAILRELDAQIDRERKPGVVGRIGFGRMLSAAAVLACATLLTLFFIQSNEQKAFADGGLVQVAEGGALDALDPDGNTLGPCPLQHTDVKVEISGLFVRTVVEQTYANPYPRTIEAVYTFPLSEKAAVDRMTMVVRGPDGEKFIEGEVKERGRARAIYEAARESGYVASLLEQERPNIFTQSVANIEPGATVKVRIATVELARRRNGVAEFVFPMVVGPRYIPGQPAAMPKLPAGWSVREGIVLRAPAGVEIAAETPFPAGRISRLLESAIPVRPNEGKSVDELYSAGEAVRFTVKYGNGSAERGVYFAQSGIGEVNGRFFFAQAQPEQGTGFAGDTTQVPDASRITPMPVKPSERAGHDISLSATIASGGPAIADVASELHAVTVRNDGATARTVTLDDRKTIPNRDFILRWRVEDASIAPAFFPHVAKGVDASVDGGYFLLTLEPPARIAPAEIRPRELVFVLDTSGSMSGFPIEKSKALAQKAIDAMRPNDTFNFITFAGATSILWPEPRAATEENRRLASEFVANAQSGGGTEMMTAINAALVQDGRSGIAPARLLDLPADGRAVRVALEAGKLGRGAKGLAIDAGGGRSIAAVVEIALPSAAADKVLLVDGTWETRDGDRVFVARTARFEDADARTRYVFFLTDGYIGNDQGVVAAVRANARASRVFSLGIGESVNRFLLEEMARAGRGVCEVVTLAESADAAIDRLVKRIASPVLTDIRLDVPASLGITEIMPGEDGIPDLFDEEPIVIVGRYKGAASGTITVRGRTGAGAWEKSIPVSLPETEAGHDVVKTLWARAKVDEILRPHLAALESQSVDAATKRSVVRLGESYSIATPFTSFVAVEKSRVVVGGKPMLVAVPVELPSGTTWAGFFGEGGREVPGIAQDASVRPGAAVEWFVQEATQRGLIERPEEQTKGKVSAEADTLSLGVPPGAPGGFSGGAAGGLGGGVAAGTVLNASVAPLQSGPATATYSRDASLSPALRSAAPSAGPSTGTGGERSQDAAVSASRRLSRMKPGRAPSGSSSFDDSSRSFEVDLMLREQVAEGGANAAEPAAGSPQEKADAKPLLSSDELDRLVRVLDRRLVLLAIAQLLGDEDRVRSLGSELGLPMTDGTLLVAIKLDAAAIERVRALGLTVEAADAARGLAVARVPVAGLAKLAATEGIKRVEPVMR